jgi:hypothetical protein
MWGIPGTRLSYTTIKPMLHTQRRYPEQRCSLLIRFYAQITVQEVVGCMVEKKVFMAQPHNLQGSDADTHPEDGTNMSQHWRAMELGC